MILFQIQEGENCWVERGSSVVLSCGGASKLGLNLGGHSGTLLSSHHSMLMVPLICVLLVCLFFFC